MSDETLEVLESLGPPRERLGRADAFAQAALEAGAFRSAMSTFLWLYDNDADPNHQLQNLARASVAAARAGDRAEFARTFRLLAGQEDRLEGLDDRKAATKGDKKPAPDGDRKVVRAGGQSDKLERPDRMIFDLDPDADDGFALVRRTARELGDVLREAGVEPFAMLTGSRGIHVVVALQRRYSFEQVRDAAVAVGSELVARRPKDLTMEFYKRKRDGLLFVDVNRNGYAATAVPPYGVRPRPGAPVATPLAWDELSDRRLKAQRYTIRTVLDRDPDVWAGLRRAAGSLPRV